MQILQILVHNFEYLLSCSFLYKLYSSDPYKDNDGLKVWLKSVDIYACFCVARKIINFPDIASSKMMT